MKEDHTFRPITENYAVVATLPVNVFSEPAPSKAIERLINKRENAHESLLKSIELNFQKTNSQVNQEIWLESKTFKSHLKKTRFDMENEMEKKIRNCTQDELVHLSSLDFGYMKNAIELFEDNNFLIVDNFYEKLKNLEKQRSNFFKAILNESYTKMQKISYKLPSDILEFFESEILRINEITLNNHHHYSILHKDLKLQIEDYVRSLHLEMMEIEERYHIAMKKVQVRSLVDVKHVNLKELLTSQAKEDAYKKESLHILKKLSEDVSFTKGVAPSLTDIEVYSRQVQVTLDALDSSARQLVKLYKMAVVNIFNRFFDGLQKITDALVEEAKEPQGRDFNFLNAEIYKPVIDDIALHYTSEVTDLQKLWGSITNYLQSNIENTYIFLQGSANLWDDHFIRIKNVQDLIQQDLLNHIDKNDITAQNFERKINKTVDRLRQESTIPKLNKLLDETNKVLDSVEQLFSDQCEDEIKILKKYLALVNQEIDVLLSEIKRFLGKFAEDENIKKGNNKKISTAELYPVEVPGNSFIPHQIRSCKHQVDAVSNWMFGLWEEIRIYMVTCRKEISEQAEIWVENQTSKLRKRKEVRMSVHKPRYKRVKTMVYEVRLDELESHLKEFSDVEKAIKKYTSESHTNNHNFKKQQEEILRDQNAQMLQIADKSNQSTKSLQVSACLEQAKALFGNTEMKLEENFTKQKASSEEESKRIRQVICNFTKSIKLFSDGGKYSHNEAKTFIKKITKVKTGLLKQIAKISKELDDVEPEIFQKLKNMKEEAIKRLERSKKELEHNEKATSKIKELQSEIFRKGHAVKFRVHRVDASIDYLATVANLNIWKKKNFQVMKNTLLECLKEIEELADYLIPDNDDTKYDGNEKGICRTYFCEFNKLISNLLDDVKKMAKDFYEKHGPISNKGKVQPTYNDFVKEIESYYENFKKQIEIHRLECAEDLINHIIKFLKVNDQIYELLEQKYPNIIDKEEIETFKQLQKKLSHQSLVIQTRRESLESVQSNGKNDCIPKDVNLVITDILQQSSDRASVLHELINKLLNHVKTKLHSFENLRKEEGGEEKYLQQ